MIFELTKMENFASHLHFRKTKCLKIQRGFAPDQGLCPWIPLGDKPPAPLYVRVQRSPYPLFGRPYYRSRLWHTVSSVCRLYVCLSSVCDVLYCGETVRPSEKLSEGVNRKPGSKSSFLGSPPYFYFRFRRYGHRDVRNCSNLRPYNCI